MAAWARWSLEGWQSERLQISEKSLWTGGPGAGGGYDYGLPAQSQSALVTSIGKQLLEGATLEPEAVAKQLGRKMHNYGDYQSFGDLIIESSGAQGEIAGYRRELDLKSAMARVRYQQGFTGFLRDYFVSHPDQVLVGRLVSTNPQKLRVRVGMPDNRTAETRIETGKTGARLVVSGALKSNGLKYGVALLLIPQCGTVKADGDALAFEGDCAVVFVLAARTNYRMRYPDYRDGGADPAALAVWTTPTRRPQDNIRCWRAARRGLPTAVRAREARSGRDQRPNYPRTGCGPDAGAGT